MKSGDWMRSKSRGASFGEWMTGVRQHHGREASKWLSEKLGVSRRTAQRYLAGSQQPSAKTGKRLNRVKASAPISRQVAANRIAGVRRVNCGTASVVSKSDGTPDGIRRLNEVDLPPGVMEQIAELYRQGEDAEAEAMFDDAVMAIYGGDPADDREGLASVLGVTNYEDGIRD